MNQVEYTALTAMLSTVKHQIAALETMLATIANIKKEKPKSTVPKPVDPSDIYLSTEEEVAYEQKLEEWRLKELQRIEANADKYFTQSMQGIADGSSDQNPA